MKIKRRLFFKFNIISFMIVFSQVIEARPAQNLILIEHVNHLVGSYHSKDGWLDETQTKKIISSEKEFIVYSCSRLKFLAGKISLEADDIDGGSLIEINESQSKKINWNPYPRNSSMINSNDLFYQNQAVKFLKHNGLKVEKVRLTKSYKIDLNGDNQSEIILTGATRDKIYDFTNPHKKGDYSFISLEYLSGKKVISKALHIDVFPNEPTEKRGDYFWNPITEYEITDIIDINGDNRMELVILGTFWEGWMVSIWEYSGKNLVKLIEMKWGH